MQRKREVMKKWKRILCIAMAAMLSCPPVSVHAGEPEETYTLKIGDGWYGKRFGNRNGSVDDRGGFGYRSNGRDRNRGDFYHRSYRIYRSYGSCRRNFGGYRNRAAGGNGRGL